MVSLERTFHGVVRLTVSDYLRAPLSCFLELSREAWYGVCLAKFSSTVQDVDGVY